MDRHLGSGRTLNHFALVSYIPEPLASYLDNLRRQLTPECNPHAHLTILPPRPFRGHVESAVEGLVAAAADFAPFQVTLGQIDVFPTSNVIFLGIESGQELVRTLNERFSEGVLEHECTYPFHPHVTIAQDFEEQDVDAHLAKARQIWEAWNGSRTFTVDRLSFVHHAVLNHWADLATVSLGAGQTVV